MTLAEWTDPTYAEIASWIRERTGLALSLHRYPDAEVKIHRAMTRAGGPHAGGSAFDPSRIPLDELVAELTVGETYFFRDPEQFNHIRSEILPQQRRLHGPDHPIRAWSAGCASGEEAYSLAILFEEEAIDPHARILATDISRPALARAKQAVYGPWSMRGDDGRLVQRYFRERGGKFHLEQRLKERVDIQYLNLALDRYPSLATGAWGMDLILCRNVLIYFDHETVRRVMRGLIDSLAEGGTLIVGASDPVFQEDGPFEIVVTGAGVFYRRDRRNTRVSRFSRANTASAPIPPRSAPVMPTATSFARPAGDGHANASAPTAEASVPAPDASSAAPASPAEAASQRLEARANAGDLAGAELEAAKLVAVEPLSMPLHFTRAMLLAALDRYADAAHALRQVIYLDRSSVAAHLALGHMLMRLGDLAGARRAYEIGRDLAAACRPEDVLPMAEGETAGRMLAAADAQLALLGGQYGTGR